MEITGFVAIGNGEKCPFCDWIQGEDFDDSMEHLLGNHRKEFGEALAGKTDDEVAGIVETECFFCHEYLGTSGIAYYRAKLPSGKMDSVPICTTCLKEKQPRFRNNDDAIVKLISDGHRTFED